MYNNFQEMRAEARENIIEVLQDYDGYLCDFHDEAFNMNYYECYTDRAIKKLEEWGVFDAIEEIKNYEQDNFGTANTDFSNPCEVINMLWYIIGEEELYTMFEGCEEYDYLWNEEVTEEEVKMLIDWVKDNERV